MEEMNWNDVEPRHLSLAECATGAYISRFKMFLASGTFISFNAEGSTLFGRIMSPDSSSHAYGLLKVNVFKLIHGFAPDVPQVRGPIGQKKNWYLPIQVSCCLGIPELVQTRSMRLIDVVTIRDIIFIFRPDMIAQGEDGRLPIECQGMERAFLLRYCESKKGILEAIHPSLCKPFSSNYLSFRNWLPECSPHCA